ncbi:tetratricopeptide repeat protein [Azospirillum cavernae]|uniref:O-linked N-acetylglucosamine transferase, SPINDLY family protein n=1 Tax=Azospirillum cavernae TaxID=2320860 RepID=UPI000E6D3184|nr:tetratricopeptide repeat protein [Azospirillum cavernae]
MTRHQAILEEAVARHRAGDLARARVLYQQRLKAAPACVDARYLLAMLDCQQGRFANAAGPLRRLWREQPGRFDIGYTLGRALHELGEFPAAVEAYARVMRGDPGNREAFVEAARSLMALRDWAAAAGVCEVGLAVHPADAALHLALGVVAGAQKRDARAVGALRRAVALEPVNAEHHCALGRALRLVNRTGEAVAALAEALRLDPGLARARLLQARLLPVAYGTEAEVAAWRARVAEALDGLAAFTPTTPDAVRAAFDAVMDSTNFYLAYQGQDDRALAVLWGDLVHRVVAARFPETAPTSRPSRAGRPARGGGRLRVGFRSAFLRDHTVLHLFRRWMTDLDRERFEVFVFADGAQDDETARLAAEVEHFRVLPADPERGARDLRRESLRSLIHLDIGMEPAGQCYGSLRLAPIQAAAWGHPVTTGLRHIDWFLSSAAMEPEDGDAHYRERLLRLPGLGVGFSPSLAPPPPADRRALGVAADDALFFCAQSLFKLLPQHDHVWADIAERVPTARFLFLESSAPGVVDVVRRRLDHAFAARGLRADDHVRWAPMQDHRGYLALNAACDVFLDSVGWSGGRTTLEAVACGLVPVTTPTAFMRGRHTAGILNALGLPDLIAADKAALVELAARLAVDVGWRDGLRARMLAARAGLFQARDWLPALESWLIETANP